MTYDIKETLEYGPFMIQIIIPVLPCCQCNNGYFIDEKGQCLGHKVNHAYTNWLDSTNHLKPIEQWEIQYYPSNIYWISPDKTEKRLVYEYKSRIN